MLHAYDNIDLHMKPEELSIPSSRLDNGKLRGS